ncbi:MAG: response regulator [Desulfosudis oleivorans]|nr:response regulator [Desulfosudis oleivorans]
MLLVDVKMPVQDGMYLMRQVQERRPGMPIIVMSGYSTRDTIREAESLGAATFIAKPFTPDELADTVEIRPENTRKGGGPCRRKKFWSLTTSASSLDSVTKILEDENFEVEVTAERPAGGGAGPAEGAYDLVLTDLRMPDIGGMRVLRDIKRAKPAVPVVMITGFATVRSAVQAMKLGAAEFLEKPFAPDDLVRTVRKALYACARLPARRSRAWSTRTRS